jgi:uncharacterized protein (TIGR02147 family)
MESAVPEQCRKVKGITVMITIFNYTDYRDYLRDYIKEKKAAAPSVSIRGLSLRAGIKSAGFLSMVLSGKRNITEDLAMRIAGALKMNKKEEQYFLLMVLYTHCKGLEVKHEILEEMLMLTRSNAVKNLQPEQFAFWDNWYNSVIRELVEVTVIKDENISELSEMLTPHVKSRDVRQAIATLEKINLIHKDPSGRYRRTDVIISTGEHFKTVVISKFQGEMIELAGDALMKITRERRDFSTVTLSVDKTGWEDIKIRCAQFRKEILSIASKIDKPDRVVQINIQGFPVTVENLKTNDRICKDKNPDGSL